MTTKNFQSRSFSFDLDELGLAPHDDYYGSMWCITVDWFWDYDQAITRDDSHEVPAKIAKCVEEGEEEVFAAVDSWITTLLKEIEQGQHEEEVF